MMKKCGGFVFCKSCSNIIAYVNSRGYKRLNLYMECTCGSIGEILLVKQGGHREGKKGYDTVPDVMGGAYVCSKCDMLIFQSREETVKACSFNAICSCGQHYGESSGFSERLGETLKRIDRSKEYMKNIFNTRL